MEKEKQNEDKRGTRARGGKEGNRGEQVGDETKRIREKLLNRTLLLPFTYVISYCLIFLPSPTTSCRPP